MSKVENPPAFPFSYRALDAAGGEHEVVHDGMSLRDWFAGQALAAVIADATAGGNVDGTGTVYDMLSQAAYRFADAMLAARLQS
jgi:hypothetical protein